MTQATPTTTVSPRILLKSTLLASCCKGHTSEPLVASFARGVPEGEPKQQKPELRPREKLSSDVKDVLVALSEIHLELPDGTSQSMASVLV